jgi:signal transduction histidine kinase
VHSYTSESGTQDFAVRELVAVREIMRAFLTADSPHEVFRLALERVTPLVGASFASVCLLEDGSDVMTLVAEYNWPARYRPWLGDMRVRVGFGPSGKAASERRPIEVADVFADQGLGAWRDVATELGYRALIALPLESARVVMGTVTFYFTEPGGFAPEQRQLVRICADQMAAAAEKSSMIDELRRTNSALLRANEEMEKQYVALLEARRVKDEFLANISHELRTPLTTVVGYTQLLQDGAEGPLTPEQAQDLAQVERASERLLTLIDDLLELTTLRRTGLEVSVEECDPREPLREAVELAGDIPPAVAVRVRQPDTMLPAMRTDRKKTVKVLISLLSNAYKFTAKGEIAVSVDVRHGRVRYRVQDTGIGIAPDLQQVIFDDFRQADGSSTRRYGGTGLGLALARRLARLLGGDITMASTLGVGSAFEVTIPLEYVEGMEHIAQ